MRQQGENPKSQTLAEPNGESNTRYDWTSATSEIESPSGAQQSPSAARNRDPILTVLRRILPQSGSVLEIGSGTGEHGSYFSAAFPFLLWQPTDYDDQALISIAAHRVASGLSNFLPPVRLDAAMPRWPVESADAIVSINMVHISPWTVTQGLMAGAKRILPTRGVLYLYGPYKVNGAHTAPSNEAFDQDLKRRNAEWGVRAVEDMAELARTNGLELVKRVSMPANNVSLVFRR